MQDFGDQVVLVTGAGRGIGRALAEAFAGQGARVAANDLTPVNLDPALRRIEAQGGKIRAFLADVASKQAVQGMIEEVREAWGRIDILINNAGVEPHAPLLALDEWDWDRTLAVNLKGPFFLTQRIANVMIELLQNGVIEAPKIINIGSISAYTSSVNRGEYCISKAGTSMMTLLFADRLAEYGDEE